MTKLNPISDAKTEAIGTPDRATHQDECGIDLIGSFMKNFLFGIIWVLFFIVPTAYPNHERPKGWKKVNLCKIKLEIPPLHSQ